MLLDYPSIHKASVFWIPCLVEAHSTFIPFTRLKLATISLHSQHELFFSTLLQAKVKHYIMNLTIFDLTIIFFL
uniref:Putative ovule protein n=1 Tax=Solanum chacoense TaxID=4108 RepID=A0A0V0GR26_SOLCH